MAGIGRAFTHQRSAGKRRFVPETTQQPREQHPDSHPRGAVRPASGATLLEPRPTGPAQRMARALAGLHPAAAFFIAAIAAWILVAGISIAAGLLVTDVLVPIDAVEDADTWLPEELERQRGYWKGRLAGAPGW